MLWQTEPFQVLERRSWPAQLEMLHTKCNCDRVMVIYGRLLLFSCSALLRELHHVLIQCSFQEKYIPQRCFHVCDTIEKVSPSWQPASSPNQTTGHVRCHMEGKYAVCSYGTVGVQLHYLSCTVWRGGFRLGSNCTGFTEVMTARAAIHYVFSWDLLWLAGCVFMYAMICLMCFTVL